MKTPFRSARSGFTLVELLIVIAIIGILAGLVSSAILKITGTAAKKRIENNSDRLRAAIVEYWHDIGRWPVKDGDKPVLAKNGRKRKDVRSDSTNDDAYETVYSYILKYKGDKTQGDKGDNSVIVTKLLDAPLPDGANTKTFIDLHNFFVPAKPNPSKWPVTEIVDAWQYHETNPDDPILLVYFAKFIHCPHCRRYYFLSGADACTYDGDHDGKYDCDWAKEHGNRAYKFTDGDRARSVDAALPYVITFDLANNIVDVESNPCDFLMNQDQD